MWIWRISNAEYADRFDGGFGLYQSGRWNDRGRRITYCATGPALCALEKLAQSQEFGLFPDNIRLVRYRVPDDIKIESVDMHDLPDNWRHQRGLSQRIGTTWLDAVSACLLKVPSVLVPVPESNDKNLLVNHRHADASRIEVAEIVSLEFDQRLL